MQHFCFERNRGHTKCAGCRIPPADPPLSGRLPAGQTAVEKVWQFAGLFAIMYCADHSIGVWRSLVARFVRDEEVTSSNLVTPTIQQSRDVPMHISFSMPGHEKNRIAPVWKFV
jgi:hypothetical protein